jgi:hypothetical protein
VSAGVVALRADGLDFAADAAAGVNAALMEISHNDFSLFDIRTKEPVCFLVLSFCLT